MAPGRGPHEGVPVPRPQAPGQWQRTTTLDPRMRKDDRKSKGREVGLVEGVRSSDLRNLRKSAQLRLMRVSRTSVPSMYGIMHVYTTILSGMMPVTAACRA